MENGRKIEKRTFPPLFSCLFVVCLLCCCVYYVSRIRAMSEREGGWTIVVIREVTLSKVKGIRKGEKRARGEGGEVRCVRLGICNPVS